MKSVGTRILYFFCICCILSFPVHATDFSSFRVIAPAEFIRGYEFPVVVSARTSAGALASGVSGTYSMEIQGSVTSTKSITLKKGMGYARAGKDSDASATNIVFPGFTGAASVHIRDDFQTATHSGILPQGAVVWSADTVHIIDAPLTIPEHTNVTIEQGAVILVAPGVSITSEGSLSVNGSEEEPVVFTSHEEEQPWGGIEILNGSGDFRYTFFMNGGGDQTRVYGHSNSQPVVLSEYSTLTMEQCYVLFNEGKALGGNASRIDMTDCLIAQCDTGGEFFKCVTRVTGSHIMDIPNDDGVFVDDDNDGFYFNSVPDSQEETVVTDCFFITGKDDAIDHNGARVRILNTWIEDFAHEGIAASSGDTLRVDNTVIIGCEQGVEAGYGSPQVFVDHCVIAGNDVGIRFGDSYDWGCTGMMHVINTIISGNSDNIRNYDLKKGGAIPGAVDISYSMTNDIEYDAYPSCIRGEPLFDGQYQLLPGSPGMTEGVDGVPLGLRSQGTGQSAILYINEIMAVNDKTFCDEYGEFDDWVEIYNPGTSPVDLAGMYISDDPGVPGKWRIPDSPVQDTVIGANSYAIIWLDRETAQGALHMDLKLSGDGEYLGLYLPDMETVVDAVAFGVQTADVSYGRDWSTGGAWRLYDVPTPGLDNAFDPAHEIKEYYITCDLSDLEHIYENYLEDIDIPITLSHASHTWTDVTMRIRGETSRKYPKKSLRVEFDSQPFSNNRDVLIFNAEYFDTSYMRQYLSSLVLRESGHPAFDVEYARLYLNGEFFGLYTRVESVDEDFLAARNMDPDGDLYKAAERGACLSIYDDVSFHWDKKTNDGSGYARMQAFIDQLNAVRDEDYYQFAKTQLDYDLMVNILAVNMLIGHYSTYYHNYYMYQDVNGTGKWVMLPWDLDKTLSTYSWNESYQKSAWSNFRTPDNPFLERAIICEPIFHDIQARITELHNTVFNQDHLGPFIDNLKNLIESSVLEDTTDNITSSAEWEAAVTSNYEYIAERYRLLQQQFYEWPSSFKLNRPETAFTDSVRLSWTGSTDPNGDQVEYTLLYSTEVNFPDDSTVSFYGLTDTTFVLPETPPEGTYFWTVFASNGETIVQGFDSRTMFEVRDTTILPGSFPTDTVLTAEDSPYIVNGTITIPAGVTVTADPGAEIRMGENASISIRGSLYLNGTAENRVSITAAEESGQWGALFFDNASESQLVNVNIEHASGNDGIFAAAISGSAETITLEQVTFTGVGNAVSLSGGHADIIHCVFGDNNSGRPIDLQAMTFTIRDCIFMHGDADVIHLENVHNSSISGCRIDGSGGHGIVVDIGSYGITLDQNEIGNCSGNAVSVGWNSEITVKRSVIVGSAAGIGVYDNSSASLDHITFHGNTIAMSLYEQTPGSGGGRIDVTNSIFSHSHEADLSADATSTTTISYCLTDTGTLAGVGNITDYPDFIDPDNGNFHLSQASPAIDAGNPLSEKDRDGSITDMGAYPKNGFSIVINEINYHSAPIHDTGDWIEVYNAGDVTVDMSGWVFQDENDDNAYTFPEGTTLQPGGFLVIANDRAALLSFYDIQGSIVGNFDFGLSGSGELLRLYDGTNVLVDSLRYDDSMEWGSASDGNGATLSLKNPELDNALSENWQDSYGFGTPGRQNDVYTDTATTTTSVSPFVLGTNYPNPFNNATIIPVTVQKRCHLRIDVYNVLGQKTECIFDGVKNPGIQLFHFSTDSVSSGIFIYKISAGGYSQSKQMMHIK